MVKRAKYYIVYSTIFGFIQHPEDIRTTMRKEMAFQFANISDARQVKERFNAGAKHDVHIFRIMEDAVV